MDSPHGAAVVAEGFGLKGPRGWAFRSVDIDAAPGSLIAVEGPSGSGRTCLLLALTGRMRPAEGHAEVGGLPLPRRMAAVRRISALGPVPSVSELDPALTAGEHLRERALLQRRFDGSLKALLRPPSERATRAKERIDGALASAGLDLDALARGGRTPVRDLERLEALRLSVALALIGRPRLLAVDDADLKLSDADRAQAWRLLRRVADGGTTVLAVCSQAPEGTTVVRASAGTGADAGADAAKPARKAGESGRRAGRFAKSARRTAKPGPGAASPGSPAAVATTGATTATAPPVHTHASTTGADAHTTSTTAATTTAPHGEETADAFAETGRA